MNEEMPGTTSTCPTCQRTFASQEELVAHVKQAHGDDQETARPSGTMREEGPQHPKFKR
jgi:hypothetical protein